MDDPATATAASNANNVVDLLSLDNKTGGGGGAMDLLSMEPSAPTDFSKPVDRQEVPQMISFANSMNQMQAATGGNPSGEMTREQLMGLLASGASLNPDQLQQVQKMLGGQGAVAATAHAPPPPATTANKDPFADIF